MASGQTQASPARSFRRTLVGDAFGGFAAMLVALPSAIAFGLIIYGPLGGEYAGPAAIAGITGTIVLGIVAPLFGGTPMLVTAPCAPAAAVVSLFVAELGANGAIPKEHIPIYIMVMALLAGVLQGAAGRLGGGKVIKYIPYPVVAGYLNGVGILIFIGQMPNFLGLPKSDGLLHGFISPSLWQWPSIAIGTTVILVMTLAPKWIKTIPAAIIALGSGLACYAALAFFLPGLRTLEGNAFVIGPIPASGGAIVEAAAKHWAQAGQLHWEHLGVIVVPAFSLAVLLSIDTLKTCVLLDALTYSRHDSNRELVGQGLANAASAMAGGIPGSSVAGATLVNFSSGGKTRLSGLLAGVFSLAVLLLFGKFVAWIPMAALAGILIVIAMRMLDFTSFRFLRHKSTMLDFFVILAVVVSAVCMSLITAAAVGVIMAILLFLREQIRASVVRRKAFGNQTFSKKKRPPSDLHILEEEGKKIIVFELQGQLFFGTADQLFTELEPYLEQCRYLLLDMRRVQSIDFTAANMLRQIHARILSHDGHLLFSSVPLSAPTHQNVRDYLNSLGISESLQHVAFFPELYDALEWAEDELLEHARGKRNADALDLADIEFFSVFRPEALEDMRSCLVEKIIPEGEKIFRHGERSDEIFFMRKGTVKIFLPRAGGAPHHLSTFVRGDFFGDMSFLDKGTRSADAVAATDVYLYILSRKAFDEFVEKHPITGRRFFERLSHVISMRLRQANAELIALEES